MLGRRRREESQIFGNELKTRHFVSYKQNHSGQPRATEIRWRQEIPFMKTIIALIFAVSAFFLAGCCTTSQQAKGFKQTFSSFDLPSDHPPEALLAKGSINFQGVRLDQVLAVYQNLAGRTVIRGQLPNVTINLQTQTPLSRVQALQLFDTVLAQNGIVMVLSGDNAVKAVTTSQSAGESPPEITRAWELLPESSSYMMRTVKLGKMRAEKVVPMLMPLSKLPNSIVAIQDQNLLILRDYSSSIRQQLRLLESLEQSQAH